VLPGLIHGHLHLCQTLFRGLAEQSDLLRWLRESIWPLEAAHTEASIAASARLGLAELIAGGVTCVNDMGTVRHTEVIGAVLEERHPRGVRQGAHGPGRGVPRGLIESRRAALDGALAIARRFHGAATGGCSVRSRRASSCRAARSVARRARRFARAGLLVHTHIAESPPKARGRSGGGRHRAHYFAARAC
jgi:cytosine/adenosine deaminase-related metal-dependent hydrolase